MTKNTKLIIGFHIQKIKNFKAIILTPVLECSDIVQIHWEKSLSRYFISVFHSIYTFFSYKIYTRKKVVNLIKIYYKPPILRSAVVQGTNLKLINFIIIIIINNDNYYYIS